MKDFITDESVVDWEKDFENYIGHDDFCKKVRYPDSSWDCNCYLKDSLMFIRSLLTSQSIKHKAEVEETAMRVREEEANEYNKIIEREVEKAVQEENERIKDWVTTILFAHPELKDEIISFLTNKES
jgi:hypothetical protein